MKIKSKACRLFLLAAVLMPVLLLPQPGLAQEPEPPTLKESGLTLTLLSDRYSYDHKVTAGEDNIFYLELRNSGDEAITDIRLSSDKPEGWVIDLELEEIDYLGPRSLRTVDVNIKPAPEAAKDEYRVTFIAEANEIIRVESYSWITVEAASPWPWIGAGIALAVVAVFIFIFMRSGRQK